MKLIAIVLSALLLWGCSQSEPDAAPEPAAESPVDVVPEEWAAAAETISAEQIESWARTLSSDEFEGRAPGSEGELKTHAFLIDEMKKMGYLPGGTDGGWLQPFELIGVTAAPPTRWKMGEREFTNSQDFVAASGVQNDTATIEDAELVFVGYGIEAPEYEWNDFKGQDLRGKVLLMLNNDPDWDPDLFEGEKRLYYGRWSYKYESAARQGAAGAIIIHTTPSAGYPWQVVQTSWTGEQFELPAGEEPRVQVEAWLTETAAAQLVADAGLSLPELVEAAKQRDFEPVSLGVTTSVELGVELRSVESANVIGLLPGSDPELSSEAVVYSAHHDHLGVGAPSFSGADPTDRIYNGARDNASGCSVLLGIAGAIRELPEAPARSTVIAFVAAEEQGLLGSAYYAQNPTFPAGRIAANVNYDSPNMLGRTRDVTYIGMGKSDLDDVVVRAAGWQGRTVHGDASPDKGFYYRSDQFSFAAIGVPATYLSIGTEFIDKPDDFGRTALATYTRERYHQPSDEITEDWDFEALRDEAELGLWSGLLISEAQEMPAWRPGDEFEAARLAAIEALESEQ